MNQESTLSHTARYAWLVWLDFVVVLLGVIAKAFNDWQNLVPWSLLALLLGAGTVAFFPKLPEQHLKLSVSMGIAGALVLNFSVGVLEFGGGWEFILHVRDNVFHPWRWLWFAISLSMPLVCLALASRKK